MAESSYLDYLQDARQALAQKKRACSQWSYRYDGENPLPDSVKSQSRASSQEPGSKSNGSSQIDGKERGDQHPPTGFMEVGSILKSTSALGDGTVASEKNGEKKVLSKEQKDNNAEDAVFLSTKDTEEDYQKKCNKGSRGMTGKEDEVQQAKLYASLESVDTFLTFLLEYNGCNPDFGDSGKSVIEAASLLEDMLKELENFGGPRGSVRFSVEDVNDNDHIDVSSLSPIAKSSHDSKASKENHGGDITQSLLTSSNQSEIPINDLSSMPSGSENASAPTKTAVTDATAWENVTTSDILADPKFKVHNTHYGGNVSQGEGQNSSSFVNISLVPEGGDKPGEGKETEQQDATSPPSSPHIPDTHSANSPREPSSPPAPSKLCKKPKDFPEGFTPTRFLASTPLFSASSKQSGDHKSAVTPAEEFPPSIMPSPVPKKQLKYLNDPPNIGKHYDRLVEVNSSYEMELS